MEYYLNKKEIIKNIGHLSAKNRKSYFNCIKREKMRKNIGFWKMILLIEYNKLKWLENKHHPLSNNMFAVFVVVVVDHDHDNI